MNRYSLISYVQTKLFVAVIGLGRGMMPKQGRDFFMSNTKLCFNKEQCPIYWRVVFMMIRCSSMQLNVGIYHKYDFRCRRINCFLSFDFVLCQYIHATDLGLGDLHCRLLEKKKLHCARDTFLLVNLFGFKLYIIVNEWTLELLEKKMY